MTDILQTIIDKDHEFLFQNYGERLPVCFKYGKNSFLYDQDDNEYIDFLSGIAVNTLGYSDVNFKEELKSQIDNLIHTSNWFHNEVQNSAAELISKHSFNGKTLFVNSGTEANEAAIKLARKYGISKDSEKYHIITFENSFHGRTFGSMSATAQKKIHDGFGPLLPGFIYLPFNDISAVKDAINQNKVCAVIFEPIQGEGGINPAKIEFVKELKAICTENDILLIADEVQTGVGRTGKTFAYKHYGILPDIITLAKGLGGGIPVGAIHTTDKLSKVFSPGSHGTTFGGNFLACKAVEYILNEISSDNLINNINNISKIIFDRLEIFKEKFKIITDIRGLGLHIGFELKINGMNIVKNALKKQLIINCTNQNVIRIMPPLNISEDTVIKGLDILELVLKEEYDANS